MTVLIKQLPNGKYCLDIDGHTPDMTYQTYAEANAYQKGVERNINTMELERDR